MNEAKRQVMASRGVQNNSRDFLSTFVILLNEEWPMLERMERSEILANSMKFLRLLTQDTFMAQRIKKDYPEILEDNKDLVLNNQENQFVIKEAQGFIYNMV